MSHNHIDNKHLFTEHLFREFYQEVFSSLVIKFGSTYITLIEDALQEAFYKALKSWKVGQLPEKPKSWLFTVAKNSIINQLKRGSKNYSLIDDISEKDFDETSLLKDAKDYQLQLLLACAKLTIKDEAKLIFTLKGICGFGVTEIANSLLISKGKVYKQLQRTKRKLKLLPKESFRDQSLQKFSIEEVSYIESIIYFMFNEGYDSVNASSNEAINKEICFEAVRLGHILEKYSYNKTTKHLLALIYFHMARFDSRRNDQGEFVSLRTQDRSKWDTSFIQLGLHYLIQPKVLNRYYLEALIASIHLSATTFSETNWKEILTLYNALLKLNYSPVIRLNRAICMFELGEDQEARKELQEIKGALQPDYLYFSVSMGEYLEDKDVELSKFWYRKSLENTRQDFRKAIIENKLKKLNNKQS